MNAAAGRFVHVERALAEAVDVALRAARLTEVDVDPALGAALVFAGYDRDWELMQGSARSERTPAIHRIRAHLRRGWRAIEFDRDRGLLHFPLGVQLDLGATAKAWAADRCAAAVYEATGAGVLVSLGGDIATAGDAPPGGWRIHVTDDHRAGLHAPGQTMTIARRWPCDVEHDGAPLAEGGRRMHHIIDPRTGVPVHERLAHRVGRSR